MQSDSLYENTFWQMSQEVSILDLYQNVKCIKSRCGATHHEMCAMQLEVKDREVMKIFGKKYLLQVWTNKNGHREMLYQEINDNPVKNWAIDINSNLFLYTLETNAPAGETDYNVVCFENKKKFNVAHPFDTPEDHVQVMESEKQGLNFIFVKDNQILLKRVDRESLTGDEIIFKEKKTVELPEGMHVISNMMNLHGSELVEFITVNQAGR